MPTIGEVLSEARRAQKKTIKEVESMTNIRSRYINALESNKYDVIPGHVYVKGFIRTYAEYLGLDYIPLLEIYKKEYEDIYNKQKSEKPAIMYHEKSRYGPMVIIAVVALVILIFLIVIWSLGRRSVSDEKVPEIITETKKESDVQKNQQPSKKQDEFKAEESTGDTGTGQEEGPFTLGVEVVNQRTYIEITVDGKVLYADVLEEGESKEWQGIKEIKVRSAHADAIKIFKNGEDLGFMGQSGGVAERVYTETGEE